VVGPGQAGPVSGLNLGGDARVVCVYREDRLIIPEDDTPLEAGDEVVCITYRDRLKALKERFKPVA
jgi:trk system potassium uptake protein TrkA